MMGIMALCPIELRLEGRTCLVVGLGPVGRRKAAAMVEAGARVIGVDPAAGGAGMPATAGVEVLPEAYRPDHLGGADLAIAAATPEVNRRVVADARRARVWVCSTSAPDEGDFTLPAVWRSGPLVLSVSTSGASPALSAVLRDRAAEALGPAAAGLAAILAELRPEVLRRLPDPRTRRRVLEEWADPRWLSIWDEQGPDAVRRALRRRLDDAGGPPGEAERPEAP
jgi:siroheme synthase-like protein